MSIHDDPLEFALADENGKILPERRARSLCEEALGLLGLEVNREAAGCLLRAFGGPEGHWGKSDKTVEHAIRDISFSDDHCYFHGAPSNPGINCYANIYLRGYKAEGFAKGPTGLIYTDETFEKSLAELLKMKGFSHAHFSYTEQGMQGDDYVSMEFFSPVKKILPLLSQKLKVVPKPKPAPKAKAKKAKA